jgi:hypothetical protein
MGGEGDAARLHVPASVRAREASRIGSRLSPYFTHCRTSESTPLS